MPPARWVSGDEAASAIAPAPMLAAASTPYDSRFRERLRDRTLFLRSLSRSSCFWYTSCARARWLTAAVFDAPPGSTLAAETRALSETTSALRSTMVYSLAQPATVVAAAKVTKVSRVIPTVAPERRRGAARSQG